jgi:hypothetical protein
MTSPTGTQRSAADRVLRGMYRRSSSWLLEHLGLSPAPAQQELAGYGPVETGVAFAVNRDFQVPASGSSVVVGGACLTNCDAQLARLRTEFVADTVPPLLLAAWADVPCVLFLPVGEEIIVSDPSISIEEWRRFGDQLEVFVNSIADFLPGGRRPILVRTDSAAVSGMLDAAASEIAGLVSADELETLYTIRPSRSGQKAPGPERLRQYRRSLVTYLPSTVSALMGEPAVRHVVVAENLHQAKAIRAARSVSAAISAGPRIDHLAHVPLPSITGTGRMARADDRSALFCMEDPASSAEKLRRMAPTVRRFWESAWVPGHLPAHGSTAGTDQLRGLFDYFRRLLVEAANTHPNAGLVMATDRTVSGGFTQ